MDRLYYRFGWKCSLYRNVRANCAGTAVNFKFTLGGTIYEDHV